MSIDVHHRRLARLIVFGTLTVTAFFLAQGSTRLLARTLLTVDSTQDAGSERARAGTRLGAARQLGDPKPILARNVFDSETGSLWPPKPEDEAVAATLDEDGNEIVEDYMDPVGLPPPCEGSLRLVASVAAPTRASWSFASIDTGSGPPLLYREGSMAGEGQVVAIFPKAVYLRPSNGRLCSVLMFAPPQPEGGARRAVPAAPVTTEPAEKARAASGGSISSDELDKGIRKISETQYSVDRGLVDKVLLNQAELMRSARIIPHEQNGQVVGVKLYGIRRNSLLGKLGIENGDVMRTINGYDMTSPDTALEAYARLRSADRLTMAVQRRGKSMNIEYQIQ